MKPVGSMFTEGKLIPKLIPLSWTTEREIKQPHMATAERARITRHRGRRCMKHTNLIHVDDGPGFTGGDHLFVQRLIETRAHQIWQSRGSPERDGLADWLRAEHEVITQFCLVRAQRFSLRAVSGLWRSGGKRQTSLTSAPAANPGHKRAKVFKRESQAKTSRQ